MIGSLIEQSLLRRSDDGRLSMLVTILEFAVEQGPAAFDKHVGHDAAP
jgi:hypothetical protein